jgi:hypothetical protein
MRLAWLCADTPRTSNPLDDTAALIDALGSSHHVHLFTADTAREFDDQHERTPFDLTVFELDNTPAHAYLSPLIHRHGGALLLRTVALPDIRTAVRASRVTVVPHPSVAEDLRAQYPESRVRVATTGVPAPGIQRMRREPGGAARPVVFGALSADRIDLLRRVFDHAGLSDTTAVFLTDAPPAQVLREADVIICAQWPWDGQPFTEALAAMAAGTPAVVLETTGTADWPALDPQSWQPRGPTPDAPVVVSVDPLDEEHSLVLAVRRLTADPALRLQLGTAAKTWWHAHATPRHAAESWERILSEATQPPAAQAE